MNDNNGKFNENEDAQEVNILINNEIKTKGFVTVKRFKEHIAPGEDAIKIAGEMKILQYVEDIYMIAFGDIRIYETDVTAEWFGSNDKYVAYEFEAEKLEIV